MMLLLKCSKSSALLFFPQLDNLVKMAIVSSATIKGIIWSYRAHYKTHQEPYNIRSMYKHTIPLYMNRVKGRISELSSINKARRFKTVEFNVLTLLDWWWPASSSGEVAALWVELRSPTALSAFPLSLPFCLPSSPGCKKPASLKPLT